MSFKVAAQVFSIGIAVLFIECVRRNKKFVDRGQSNH